MGTDSDAIRRPAGPTSFDAHSHLPGAGSSPPDHPRVVCGTREADWAAVLAQAASDGQSIPMLGLHPWFVAEASPDWPLRLEALLRDHPAGVGECGLDFARRDTDRAECMPSPGAPRRSGRCKPWESSSPFPAIS